MTEIIVPGKPAKEGRGQTGYSYRLERVRHTNDHLPPFRCDSLTKGRFYLCGRCFGTLGDGPATSGAEMWMCGTDRQGKFIIEDSTQQPVVPRNAWCHKCGRHAWPAD